MLTTSLLRTIQKTFIKMIMRPLGDFKAIQAHFLPNS
jgi:hypothetical protein